MTQAPVSVKVSAVAQGIQIRHRRELPSFVSVLTQGPDVLLKIPADKQGKIAVLELADGGFAIISLLSEQGSTLWFFLVEQCRRRGLKFKGFFTCEESLLQTLLKSREPENDDFLEMDEREIFDEIISDSYAIQWFKEQVFLCHELGASDIHLEIRKSHALIRIRRDGLMRVIGTHPASRVLQAVAACYTLLAEDRSRSDVAFSQYAAQAAMIPLQSDKNPIQLRYQSHPTVGGLDVVFRILKNDVRDSSNVPSVADLGYTHDQSQLLTEAMASSTGGIFIAGVTGSGKTTTLTSLLTRMAENGRRKIITIEDPVEYQVQGVSHFSVQRNSDSDADPFGPAVMAFLRMDPDIGMLGEIRDRLSGQMAYTAIQTGHKLLTTVHATSALGIVARLCGPQIGLHREDVCNMDFLSLLVYQMLVPLNCTHCKVPATAVMPMEKLKRFHQYFGLNLEAMFSASDQGCSHCRPDMIELEKVGHNGIRGMKVAAEVIRPDVTMLSLLRQGDDLKAFQYWRKLQNMTAFSEHNMLGKPAWAHSLFDVSTGVLDPFYFEHLYGSIDLLVER